MLARQDRGGVLTTQSRDAEDSRWVSQVHTELRLSLFNLDAAHQATSGDIDIEELRFEGTRPCTEVVVLFRIRTSLQCLRGYRWGSVWDWRDQDPEFLAHVIWANFEESLLRVSNECDTDSINWVE